MLTASQSTLFSALADPRRVMITQMLAEHGQMNATQISSQFDISPPAISQHLKILRDADVVVMEKQAQRRLYRINPIVIEELEEWVSSLKRTWEARYDRLEKLLQQSENHQIK